MYDSLRGNAFKLLMHVINYKEFTALTNGMCIAEAFPGLCVLPCEVVLISTCDWVAVAIAWLAGTYKSIVTWLWYLSMFMLVLFQDIVL